MSIIEERRISIGISACVYGCKTRYNGKGIDVMRFFGREKESFVFTPVCPEVQSGMGIPRDPISLRGGGGDDVWQGDAKIKNRGGEDVTESVKDGCICCMKTLEKAKVDAFVFMEGSPSCGVYRTSLKGRRLGHPPGIFGALLLEKRIFLIPATDLQSPIKRWDWIRRLFAFTWLKSLPLENKKDIYAMWHALKFICQEIDNEKARKIGRNIASMKEAFEAEYAEELRDKILEMLRKPSTPAKIKQMLWKNYAYYRKNYKREIESINEPLTLRNMTEVVKELSTMELAAFKEGFIFGASPVIFRDGRGRK